MNNTEVNRAAEFEDLSAIASSDIIGRSIQRQFERARRDQSRRVIVIPQGLKSVHLEFHAPSTARIPREMREIRMPNDSIKPPIPRLPMLY